MMQQCMWKSSLLVSSTFSHDLPGRQIRSSTVDKTYHGWPKESSLIYSQELQALDQGCTSIPFEHICHCYAMCLPANVSAVLADYVWHNEPVRPHVDMWLCCIAFVNNTFAPVVAPILIVRAVSWFHTSSLIPLQHSRCSLGFPYGWSS